MPADTPLFFTALINSGKLIQRLLILPTYKLPPLAFQLRDRTRRMGNLQRPKVVASAAAVEEAWSSRSGMMLEEYTESGSDVREGVARAKSLTDEDLDDLKGCLDLGFGFSYNDIPELCNTLPALELCYSMSQRFLADQRQKRSADDADAAPDGERSDPFSVPIANWRISSPGDNPDEVKARLRYWAQAVACTVKLCN